MVTAERKSPLPSWYARRESAMLRPMPSVMEYSTNVVLPDGEMAGQKYNPLIHPGQICTIQAIDNGATWIAITKCVQDGGSLVSFIPILRRVHQESQTAMIAYPTREKANDAWNNKIWPILMNQGGLRPRHGAGSQGGVGSTTTFPGGGKVMLRASGGRHEVGQASDTADVLLCDELDDWEDLRRIRLIERRVSRSQAPLLIYVSTVKRDGSEGVDASRILALFRSGTATRIEYPCVHCAAMFIFEWEMVDLETRTIVCPHCKEKIDDHQRLAMLTHWRRKDANVSEKFSILWSALDSPFSILVNGKRRPTLDGLCEEYAEALTAVTRFEYGYMRQFFRDRLCRTFTEPPMEGELTNTGLAAFSARSTLVKRIIPSWVRYLTIAQDPGKFVHYWMVMGFGEGLRWCIVDYGYERVVPFNEGKPTREPLDSDRIATLNLIRDKANDGWQLEGTANKMSPVQRGVDIGYEMKLITGWLNGEPGWKAMRGLGSKDRDDSSRLAPESKDDVKRLSEELEKMGSLKVFRPKGWRRMVYGLIGDTIRHNIHAGLLRNPGDMGSGMIPHGLKPSDMLILHLCGEVWEPSTVKDGRQIPGFWAHPHGGWDLLDCTRYGYALGLIHLYHPDSYDNRPASQEETQSIDDARSWITGY